MKLFERADAADITAFKDDVRAAVKNCTSLEQAAQTLAKKVYTTFQSSTVLARVYVTVPYAKLPADARGFVDTLVASTDATAALTDATPCLSLLGTYGVEPAWQSRRTSKGHLAIPLLSREFVESAPMIARLLKDLGIDLAWIDDPSSDVSRVLVGGFNGVFYVQDAATATNAKGAHIIPAQDFVAQHKVKTVFGMGGFYLQGAMVAIILFTREHLTRMQAERFSALSGILKVATHAHVVGGKIFEPR
jgi:hypothetical protein